MLTGFEQQTKDLSDKEKIQARALWRYMSAAFSAGRSITNAELAQKLKEETGESMGGARVRKAINWMHTSGHLPRLVATSNGYSKARTRQELLDYAESLEGRVNAITARLNVVRSDIAQFNQPPTQDLFNGQS